MNVGQVDTLRRIGNPPGRVTENCRADFQSAAGYQLLSTCPTSEKSSRRATKQRFSTGIPACVGCDFFHSFLVAGSDVTVDDTVGHLMDVGRLRRRILSWYRKHKRDLPWRQSRDPYRIWISEIMLQQTLVAAVLPYYERVLPRFPDAPA